MRAAAAEAIFELARVDDRVVFVGSDLGAGAMNEMRSAFPDRVFMEGVAEQYVMGMAAGLAMDGFTPFVSSIATFITRRCYEQLCVDVCLHGLPVRIVGTGGGAVYGLLGPTHVAADDLAIVRSCPNLTVLVPGDRAETAALVRQTASLEGPAYLRLGPPAPVPLPVAGPITMGAAVVLREGADVALVALGPMTIEALAVADLLAEAGVAAMVVHVHSLIPFDVAAVITAAMAAPLVVTVEEHSITGGLGSTVAEILADAGSDTRLVRAGFPSGLVSGAEKRPAVLAAYGLDAPGLATSVLAALGDPAGVPR